MSTTASQGNRIRRRCRACVLRNRRSSSYLTRISPSSWTSEMACYQRRVLPCTRHFCAPSATRNLRIAVPWSCRARRSRVKLWNRILANQVSRCQGLYRGETTNLRYEPPCGPRDWSILSAVFQNPSLLGRERVEFGLRAGGLSKARATPARQLLASRARCRSPSSRRGSHMAGRLTGETVARF